MFCLVLLVQSGPQQTDSKRIKERTNSWQRQILGQTTKAAMRSSTKRDDNANEMNSLPPLFHFHFLYSQEATAHLLRPSFHHVLIKGR